MAEILSAELALRGLAVSIEEQPDEKGVSLPVVVATSPVTAGRSAPAPLLLVGHFDTVLPASRPSREGGQLFATGAIDMKGGIVVFLKAIDLLARRGGSRPELRLVLVPDEEVGGAISRRAVATAGRTARALWVLEPGERRGAAETLVTGRRGMFHWRLEVRGRTAHSGLAFWQGRSAAVAAADWVTRAAALSRPGGGATVNVARMVAGEQQLVTVLATEGNLPGSKARDASRFGTAHQLNVVPDRALVEGEARFLRLEEADGLAEGLAELAREVAARHDVACDFAHDAAVAPVDPDRLPRLPAERAVALAAAAGWELTLEDDRGGISFPNFLSEPGRIPVLDGLGPVGDGMHTRREHVDLVSLERRIRLLADLLQAEAEATGGA
jgi:glutamate carboxypeptidase